MRRRQWPHRTKNEHSASGIIQYVGRRFVIAAAAAAASAVQMGEAYFSCPLVCCFRFHRWESGNWVCVCDFLKCSFFSHKTLLWLGFYFLFWCGLLYMYIFGLLQRPVAGEEQKKRKDSWWFFSVTDIGLGFIRVVFCTYHVLLREFVILSICWMGSELSTRFSNENSYVATYKTI